MNIYLSMQVDEILFRSNYCWFLLSSLINTVKMKILSGPKIYFNTKAAAIEQVNKLDLIIKNKPEDNLNSVGEYIDLRYANNVYIK